MAYQIEEDEGVRSGILRSAGEELDRALHELTEQISEDPVEAVHSARKAVKKERALLRLARGSMDPQQRRRENAALRDAARGLSTARDAEAMLETLDALSERYVGQLPESAFGRIRARLEERRDRERAELAVSAVGGEAADELAAVRARQADWKLSRGGWRGLEPGLLRGYRDGRELFTRARSQPEFAEWHDWRKRVKDLWYQQRLLAPVAGPAVKGQVKELHRLADVLGDDHDLGVLRATLESERMSPPVDLDAVNGLIEYRRRELQTEAAQLGARIYHESPGRFVARMRCSWEAGRALARAGRAQDPVELTHALRASA
jgi:CHAD domain-containing protein